MTKETISNLAYANGGKSENGMTKGESSHFSFLLLTFLTPLTRSSAHKIPPSSSFSFSPISPFNVSDYCGQLLRGEMRWAFGEESLSHEETFLTVGGERAVARPVVESPADTNPICGATPLRSEPAHRRIRRGQYS